MLMPGGLGAVFEGQVGHGRARDRGLEERRLRHRPGRHVSAVGPAADADAVGIGDALLDQPIRAGHDVLEIAAAPVEAVDDHEIIAVARRAADVRREDDEAARGQKLAPGVEAGRPGAGRAAVDEDDRGQLRSGQARPRA